jgi:hypothetical protein
VGVEIVRPSREILAFYNEHVSGNHLDVGVGTGYFLDRCRFPVAHPTLARLDLNPNSLRVASRRRRRYRPTTHLANALQPLPIASSKFDSIGLSYLLHCLPGPMQGKGAVFEHLKPWLNDGGVLFGTTILGRGVRHHALAQSPMRLYNWKGIFGNADDSVEQLEERLRANFSAPSVRVVGCAAFFVAHIGDHQPHGARPHRLKDDLR